MIIHPVQYQPGMKLPELEDPGTAADLLAGKQLVDQYGNPLTGTMPKRSANDLTASGAKVTVPAGYYPSKASKSVASAAHPQPTLSRSGATVTASHVQSAGYTSGGTTTKTLTLPTQAGKTVTPGAAAQTAVAGGVFTTGVVTVAGDANLVAENIKKGVSIFGVEGSYACGNMIAFYQTVTFIHSLERNPFLTGFESDGTYADFASVSSGASVKLAPGLLRLQVRNASSVVSSDPGIVVVDDYDEVTSSARIYHLRINYVNQSYAVTITIS